MACIRGELDRGPASAEAARAREVERRQTVAPRLGQSDLAKANAPVAGGIAQGSPDRRIAVGGSGYAEAGREEVGCGERQRGRTNAEVERRPGAAGDRQAA